MNFQSPSVKAVTHGFKVAATILGSVFVTGASIYFANPVNLIAFAQYFNHWGIPVSLVNIVVAGILKYISEHKKQSVPVTIDSLPDDQITPSA